VRASDRVCAVFDVLRASSTLVTLLDRGAAPVYIAETVDAARMLAARLPQRPLLCGEIGGLPPADFDYGNSPTELASVSLGGQAVVLATSNGTRALAALAAAPVVLVGCFLNASAVAAYARSTAAADGLDLALVCAGDESGTQFSLEDALAAGYVVERLRASAASAGDALDLDDGAIAAWRLYRSYAAASGPAEAAARGFEEAFHGRELARLGFDADLAYCAAVDSSTMVPRLSRDGETLLLRPAGVGGGCPTEAVPPR
jgi:2-phosphosulfolactate phosphatase